MRIVTGTQMQELDRRAMEEHRIPGLILMENAGHQAARAAKEFLGRVRGKTIHVIVGSGNNGGDGLVCARHLEEMGASVNVFFVGDEQRVKGDARVMFSAWQGRGGEVKQLPTGSLLADLIVDGIMGTGCHGPLRSPAKEAVQRINEASPPVLSLDVPSGVNADTGFVHGDAVRATMTVTFALPKAGLLLYPGAGYTGRVVVAPIGMPPSCYQGVPFHLISGPTVRELMPRRLDNAHKGNHGRILVIGGSLGLAGSCVLAARAALRSGAGLVTVAVPQPVAGQVATSLTEAMTLALPADAGGQLSPDGVGMLLERSETMDVVALGPGLGRGEGVRAVVNQFLDGCSCPVVVDADGLNALIGGRRLPGAVLTPHPGEAGRLLGISPREVERDRIGSARELARRFDAATVLKGAGTLVAIPGGELYMEPTVNPLLATGGTGDVLTGAVAACLGQGAVGTAAALVGVHLHARAGLLLGCRLGKAGMLAGELADTLPEARRLVENEEIMESEWLWDSASCQTV